MKNEPAPKIEPEPLPTLDELLANEAMRLWAEGRWRVRKVERQPGPDVFRVECISRRWLRHPRWEPVSSWTTQHAALLVISRAWRNDAAPTVWP